jgi:ferrochelatase
VRRRYEAIGGRSPLNDICGELAAKLEALVGVSTRVAMRLWHPYPKDVLPELAREGFERVAVLPLAQHSAKIYGDAVKEAAADLAKAGGPSLDVACPPNWGREPKLTLAYASAIRKALAELPAAARAKTALVMTAHSLPVAVVRAGDPYEAEVAASAAAIVDALGADAPAHRVVAFQSQGMGTGPGGRPIEWLGPDLPSEIVRAAGRGDTHVLVAPIGFLADHVEILYDLDIEAAAWAREHGLTLSRTRSLNAEPLLVEALAAALSPLLGRG